MNEEQEVIAARGEGEGPAFFIVFDPDTMRMVTTLIPSDGQSRFTDQGLRVEPYAEGGYRKVRGSRTVEPWPVAVPDEIDGGE